MMSLRAVNSGCGYVYLQRSVATNDAADIDAPSLAAYYQAKGTPPGRWLGRGLVGLGSKVISEGAQISELQMAALFGEGIHPDADAMLANGIGLKGCHIGRPFPNFTAGDPVLIAVRDAEQAFRVTHGRLPDDEEKSAMVCEVATPLFVDFHGVEPTSGREVIAWVNARKDKVRQGVAGYDFTFSPAKSISALWALADESTASAIAACHHRAVAQAMEWAEEEFIRTRQGAGGKYQVKTKGILAAEFTHFDTRAGDPDLHSHVLVANKVQDEQGKWKSLDGRTIFKFHQAMSFRYDALVRDEITRSLGIDFVAHERGEGKQPVWEVAGMTPSVLEQFSKRRAGAKPVFDRKVADFIERTGTSPNTTMLRTLWQQAILETRDEKKPAESLATLRAGWREELAANRSGADILESVTQLSRGTARERDDWDEGVHLAQAAAETIEIVSSRRSVFRRSHVHTAVAAALSRYRFKSAEEFNAQAETVVNHVIEAYGISLNGTELAELPDALVGEDGHGKDRLLDAEVFTTPALLAAEQAVVDAADEPTAHTVTDDLVDSVLDAHKKETGWALNAGQQQLARHLLTSGALVATGVGPAGTGKTASMKVVATAWQAAGHRVHALAPSAAAADVLADDIGVEAHTIDSLTFTWRGHHPTKPGGELSALGVEIHPGDMLLVDEAGMASTKNLAALVEIARASGAVVRLVGDHKQLSAVENGGLFGALTKLRPTAQLSDVMRFGDDKEQAEASMQLRDGNVGGLSFYDKRGWIHGGMRAEMLTKAADDYLADLAAGRTSLVLASTNDDVATLNDYVRTHRIEAGEVDVSETVGLAGGVQAGLGDRVIARQNKRFSQDSDGVSGKVVNGDVFTVIGFTETGDVEVARDSGGTQTLPARYVSEHVHLGYASTVHRAQGATVDVCRTVIDANTDRAGLYVGMSRGKLSNQAYVVAEASFDFDAEEGHYHYQGAAQPPTALSVLERVVARDSREKSALETLADETLAATAPERMRELWRMGKELIVDTIVDRDCTQWLAAQPADRRALIATSAEGAKPIRSAWKALVASGIDPVPLVQAMDFAGAHDIALLAAFKLREHLPDKPVEFDAVMPIWRDYLDGQLYDWMSENMPASTEMVVEVTRPRAEVVAGGSYRGESFAGCDFTGVNLSNVTFSHCDFTGAVFDNATISTTQFLSCTVDDTTFTGAHLTLTTFTDCSLDRCDFSHATIGGSTLARMALINCRAQLIVMREAIIRALRVVASTVAGLDLTGAQLTSVRLERSTITDTHITAAATTSPGALQIEDCTVDDELAGHAAPAAATRPASRVSTPPAGAQPVSPAWPASEHTTVRDSDLEA